MCTIYENIKVLCNEKGIKPGRMCTDIGISKSILTGLKNGTKKNIQTDTAQKIADYFGVSVDRVLGSDQKEKSPTPNGVELSEDDLKHLRAFHAADEETKAAITMLLKKFERGESL